MEILHSKIEILLFKSGDYAFQNENSTDILK